MIPRFLATILFCYLFLGSLCAQNTFTAYECKYQSATELEKLIRPLLPPDAGIQLVIDQQRNQLLLSGPDAAHSLFRNALRQSDVPTGKPPLQLVNPVTVNKDTPVDPTETVAIPVDANAINALVRQFEQIFGKRLTTITPGRVYELSVREPTVRTSLIFDTNNRRMVLSGPSRIVGQLKSLVERLSAQSSDGFRVQVHRLQRESHSSLRDAVRSINDKRSVPGRAVLPNEQTRFVMPPGSMIRPVVFQTISDQEVGETVDPALRQFEGVEIESLPDLDVILLRGRQPDLDQLAKVIEQLERISEETQPNVQILPLQHAGSEGIASIIETVSEDLIGGRQGRVSVTPLVKPNALLLIGWGDSVETIIDLAKKLDTPVTPSTQSTVFRLKYASVETVATAVENFLDDRAGLGPKVTVTPDLRTNSLVVYAAPRDLLEVRKLIEDLDQPGGQAMLRTKIIEIKNSLAEDIAETLQDAIGDSDQGNSLVLEVMGQDGKQILTSGVLNELQITPNPRNNTLILSARAESLPLLEALIEQLDTPAGEVQLKIFQIDNGDAASLIETLRSLLPSQTGSSTTPVPSVAPGETSLAPLRFSVDLRSNSIIATGSEGDLRIVEALLLRLDQTTDQQRKSTVIQLKNAPAVDVASAINQFLLNRRQIEQAAPGESNPFQEIEREVVVVPEPVANKLILAATPRFYDEIKALIDKLDEQPPQVMIQVLIAEVSLNHVKEFGVELGVQSSVLFDRSLLGDLLTTTNSSQNSTAAGVTTVTEEIIQAASNIPGFLFNDSAPLGNSGSSQAVSSAGEIGGQGLSNFGVGRTSSNTGFGGLVLSASSQNVSVLLRALNETRRVRVLSRPQIRTLDNQPAFIQVGQRVPRIIGSTVNQNGQSNAIDLENVGLILGVTPRVSPDNMVVMEIDAEKSSLGNEQDGIPVAVSTDGTVIRSPRVDTTTAQATVSAANGETIILGGLISENRDVTHRNLPGIENIPILRNLFRYDGDVWKRSELLIILTPHVIKSAEDSERLKQAEIARMNWCEADVYRIQGDINLPAIHPVGYETDTESDETPVIYPDTNPSGELGPSDESDTKEASSLREMITKP